MNTYFYFGIASVSIKYFLEISDVPFFVGRLQMNHSDEKHYITSNLLNQQSLYCSMAGTSYIVFN